MPPHPYNIRTDVAALYTKALGLASDPATVWPERGHAASVCLLLAAEVDYDDGLALSAVAAAGTMLECSPYAHDLLAAAREIARDESVLIGPTLELAAAAHSDGHHDTVVVALLQLLEVPSFTGDVPAAWLVAACSVDGEADYWLRRLVRRWVELHGAEHEGVRAVISDRADVWFPTRRFRLDVLHAMHAAEPTAAGWVALASRRDEMNSPLGLSFGKRHGNAVAALRDALLRQVPAATHAALEGWLEELST